jgi:F0F1-type ATP synthase membrane subunit b/b'
MMTFPPAVVLAVAVALLIGAGLAFVVTRAVYSARLQEAQRRAGRVQKALAEANDRLQQARRQSEVFRRELVEARRVRPAPRVEPAAPPRIEPDDSPPPLPAGFADTMPFTG